MGNARSIEAKASICKISSGDFQQHLSLIYITRNYLEYISKFVNSSIIPPSTLSSILPDANLTEYFRENYPQFGSSYELINKLKYSYIQLNSNDDKRKLIIEVFENLSAAIALMFDNFKNTCDFDNYAIKNELGPEM
jgi:hypothetical protein